jgi:hypothetical protein
LFNPLKIKPEKKMEGLHHANYAIATLEKELESLRLAMQGFSEEHKTEYSEAWKDRSKKEKELVKAIKLLK